MYFTFGVARRWDLPQPSTVLNTPQRWDMIGVSRLLFHASSICSYPESNPQDRMVLISIEAKWDEMELTMTNPATLQRTSVLIELLDFVHILGRPLNASFDLDHTKSMASGIISAIGFSKPCRTKILKCKKRAFCSGLNSKLRTQNCIEYYTCRYTASLRYTFSIIYIFLIEWKSIAIFPPQFPNSPQ